MKIVMKRLVLFFVAIIFAQQLSFAQSAPHAPEDKCTIGVDMGSGEYTLSVASGSDSVTIPVGATVRIVVSKTSGLSWQKFGEYFTEPQRRQTDGGDTVYEFVCNKVTPVKSKCEVVIICGKEKHKIILASKAAEDVFPLKVIQEGGSSYVLNPSTLSVCKTGHVSFDYNEEYAELKLGEDIIGSGSEITVNETMNFSYEVFGKKTFSLKVDCLDRNGIAEELRKRKTLQPNDTLLVYKYIELSEAYEVEQQTKYDRLKAEIAAAEKELDKYRSLFVQDKSIFDQKFGFDVPEPFEALVTLVNDVNSWKSECDEVLGNIDVLKATYSNPSEDAIYSLCGDRIISLNLDRHSISKRIGILSEEQQEYVNELIENFRKSLLVYIQ